MPTISARGALEFHLNASENDGLIDTVRQADASKGRRRRLVVGGTAGICLAAVLVVRKAVTPCQVGNVAVVPEAGGSIVSLVESSPEDLLRLGRRVDHGAVARFLADSEAARAGVEEKAAATPEAKASDEAALRRLVASAQANATEAHGLMQRALSTAPVEWHKKRNELLKLLAGMTAVGLREQKTPAQQASLASCTFNTLQATTQLAALATSINDAAKTCENGKADGVSSTVCAINVEQIISSIAAMAATLSLAANNCADTLVPNIDALCAGTITGLIQSLMDFSIGAELAASSCTTTDLDRLGVAPSNVGQPRRRLDEHDSAAQVRRLLLGGGKQATATFCAVDVSSMAWYLAQAGIAINTAANPNAGAVCPPKGAFGGNIIKGKFYQQSESFCSVSITGAIYGFLEAIKYIQMAVVHCSDSWNFGALCGAGIDGMLAAMDGVAFAGSAMHLSCDALKHSAWSGQTKLNMANNALGNSGNFGRRLAAEGQESAEALKERFASPEEAWKSIGFDVASPESELRTVKPLQPSAQRVLGRLREHVPSPAATEPRALLGGQHLCSN